MQPYSSDPSMASACLGPGHTINNTDVGVCRGQWQWYQLSTVQQHEVPYYVIEQPANGGPAQHVRKTRTEMQRHAVAFEVNAGHCPYSYCESGGAPRASGAQSRRGPDR